EVDVVGVGHILVDALLDETQPEHGDVEVDAFLHVAGDRGDVVDAGQTCGHWSLSLVRTRTIVARGFALDPRPDFRRERLLDLLLDVRHEADGAGHHGQAATHSPRDSELARDGADGA